MAETVLFWILAISASLGAISVVLTQNVVRMAFWLIVALGSTAGLFFLLHADFVAATQILVYVGGTVVLLIFGVMLTASGPFNQIKMSPGNLIAVAGLGAVVLLIVTRSVTAVNWDRSILRQVVISSDRMNEIRSASSTDDEEIKLLDSAFHAHKVNGAEVFQYTPHSELSDEKNAQLLSLLKENGLSFSPSSETGGTIRPLGFALLGSRPDRDGTDKNTPHGFARLSDGFYVARGSAASTAHHDKAHEEHEHHADTEPEVALSPGYLLPFEIASVHLLVVLIGAAYLARAKRRVDANL